MEGQTVTEVLRRLHKPGYRSLRPPGYTGNRRDPRIMLAVEAMSRHTADAGWQLTKGFEHAGYALCGYGFTEAETEVPKILNRLDPGTVVIQDKREWEGLTAGQSEQADKMRFRNVEALAERDDLFKVTVLKDAQQRPAYHRRSAREMGVHAWIIYYHPRIVSRVAPYVRPEHCIRTTHSVNRDYIPAYTAKDREGCLLSGAVSSHYPLRRRLINNRLVLPDVRYLKHPGYHARECVTPKYMKMLSRHKVSLCTASRYGYALRKHFEGTACGCIVVTSLPTDEVLPEIDGNLVRVRPDVPMGELEKLLLKLYREYDPEKQEHYAELAKTYYDYRAVYSRLAEDIERLRQSYGS